MAIESTAVPLPSEIVMPLAGWKLVEEKDLGFTFVVLLGVAGAVGSLAGSLIEYYIARAGGRPLIEKYGKYLLITNADLDRADRWFETRMPNAATRPLFDRARNLGVAISFGYAELTPEGQHFNTQILTDRSANSRDD